MYPSTHHKLWSSYRKSRMISRDFHSNKKRISVATLFKKHVEEYCATTTIHGLSHAANNKNSKIERIFWTIVSIIGLGVVVLLAYLLLYRYNMSPTITTLESYSYPTWKIPFPAVTLCNVNKVKKSALEPIFEKLLINQINKSDIEEFFKKVTALITRDHIVISETDKVIQENLIKHMNCTIDEIMRAVAQPCSELLVSCVWQDERIDCNQLFSISKSVEGYCCSFNYNLKYHENSSTPDDKFGGTGRQDGLIVIINTHIEDYFATSDPYYGVKVLIHAPDVYPETSLLSEVLQPGKVMSLAIDPHHVESEENVKDLKLSQRTCLFSDEVSLLTVKEYNFQNCITECRVQIILSICNCIPFIYPFNNNSSKICDLTDALCLYRNAAIFSNLLLNNTDGNSEIMCPHCLPDCSELIYTLSSSLQNMFKKNFSIGPPIRENESHLHVYFRDIISIKYRKEAMVTWDILVASLGGIFGLCLGGSVLSIVELIYHFTFKFIKRIKNSKIRPQKPVLLNFIR